MTVKLLTEHHLEFLSLTGGCTCLSESTLVKMPHCWNHMTRLIMYWCNSKQFQMMIKLYMSGDKIIDYIVREQECT